MLPRVVGLAAYRKTSGSVPSGRFKQVGVQQIHKIDVADDSAQLEAMVALTQKRTVPQIFIGDTYVGGYDSLLSLDQSGALTDLLANP